MHIAFGQITGIDLLCKSVMRGLHDHTLLANFCEANSLQSKEFYSLNLNSLIEQSFSYIFVHENPFLIWKKIRGTLGVHLWLGPHNIFQVILDL